MWSVPHFSTKLTINDNDRRLTYYESLKENEFWRIALNISFGY